MSFLNLGLLEFGALGTVLAAAVIALYLLDRSKRRRVVATLRFWTAGQLPQEMQRKRRIHQPLSLLLQVLSILLILLAIAGPRFGGSGTARDHVLLLDTSAWMGARTRQGILLDQAKTAALTYLTSLPENDRVMLVRADALATPVTQFEANHGAVANAVRQSRPSTSSLNLELALEFAGRVQRLQSERAGEIVFAGAGRVPKQDSEPTTPANLRVLLIPSQGENVGLRKMGLRRIANQKDMWEAFVGTHNDGVNARDIVIELSLGGASVGTKALKLAAGAEDQATFTFTASTAGLVEARLRSANGRADSFPQDDRVAVELPVGKTLHVAVYSPEPELLKALLSGNPQVEATFAAPSTFTADAKADIFIFDRYVPAQLPAGAATLWIEPPAGSPFTVRSVAQKAKLERWHEETPLAAGLYTKDVELESAQIFAAASGDQIVAETAQGPVVVARPGTFKMAALGFHPLRSTMKYDLAAPLLMANLLRWVSPDIFRRWDVQAASVGTVNVALENGVDPASIKVLADNQRPLPFTIERNQLRFFSGAPGNVRVITGDRETVYSLTLPDVGDTTWNPPANVPRGMPRGGGESSGPITWWPWLAVAGAFGLLADWLLFGHSRIRRLTTAGSAAAGAESSAWRKAS